MEKNKTMSFISKLWNKWFGAKKTTTTSSTSSYTSVSVTPASPVRPVKTESKPASRTSVQSRGQGSSYYDEAPNTGVDPVLVAVTVSNPSNDSEPARVVEPEVVQYTEPSSHLSPYESNASGYSHVDSPASTHYDSGSSHTSYDSGSSHTSYDSGSSSYDSGSSSSDCGGSGD